MVDALAHRVFSPPSHPGHSRNCLGGPFSPVAGPMKEPPRSKSPQIRKSLPLLSAGVLAVIACLLLVQPSIASDPECSQSESTAPSSKDSSTVVNYRRSSLLDPEELELLRTLTPRTHPVKTEPASPPGTRHRLLVKFVDQLEARPNEKGNLILTPQGKSWKSSIASATAGMKLRFRPLHSTPEASLKALAKRAALRSGCMQPDPLSLMEVRAKNDSPETILAAARALQALDEVEYVEIESIDAPPPPPSADIFPDTPSLVSYQTYRQPAQGIGVDFVWDTYGIKGNSGLRITDCEYKFNADHEDLAGLASLQPGVTSMYSNYGDDHGTAVLGILAAGDNGYGMNGSVPHCQIHFYPESATMDGGAIQFRTSAITAAIAASAPGDIVMLEMQTWGPGGDFGPAEYQNSVWDAVKTGTDAGVIIIASAGNGRQNMDSSSWAEYRDRGDSGAIIVGAGYSSRSRISYSTYGSRVNLQGWGSGVATTGYGSLAKYGDDHNQEYTSSFNGTSSATPIVASAAALVQSVAIQKLGTRLTPGEMRTLLVSTGSPQTGYTSNRIGPLPDLTAAVPQLLSTEFTNTTSISIPDLGDASPFPSTIPVSGVNGIINAVRVKLNGITHPDPRNLDITLVGPGGQAIPLMSDAGDSYKMSNTSLMFDDTAPTAVPESSAIVPGRWKPANYGSPVESLPPGTSGPFVANLNSLAAGGANGDWKLYVTDDYAGGSGSIASWSVSFNITPYPEAQFTAETSTVQEGGQPFEVTATLSEATSVDVSIPFGISGTASDPDDFTITTGPIFIPAGQTSGSVTVTLTDDSLDEDDKTLILTIETPTHATTGAISSHSITILDNDVTLAISTTGDDPPPEVGEQRIYTEGTEVTTSTVELIMEGNARHRCTGWTGSGSVPPEGTGYTATFSIQQNSSIRWKRKTEYRLDVMASGHGSISGDSGWENRDSLVPLSASPAQGHRFAGWNITSGTLSAGTPADPQITLRMDQPASLTAVFLPLTARDAYEDWATENTLSSIPSDIPHADGTPNLLKYAFNLNPAGPDSRSLLPATGTCGLPCLSVDHSVEPAVLRLEYIRRIGSGLVYTPMESQTLGNDSWAPVSGAETSVPIDTVWERVTFERTLDPQEPGRFFKVEVTLPDTPL